jgi:hypothetical protein
MQRSPFRRRSDEVPWRWSATLEEFMAKFPMILRRMHGKIDEDESSSWMRRHENRRLGLE